MASEEFSVPVKAWLKPAMFRRLNATAEANQVTVADLIAECVRRQLAGAGPIDAAKVMDELPVLGPSTRPSKPPVRRGAKWAVRRPWVAIAPDATMHGPFDSQPEGMEFVRSQLAPAVEGEKPKKRRRIEWTPAMDDLIRLRHSERVSDMKIAAELGELQPAVSARRKVLGLPSLFRSPNTRGAGRG